MNSRSSHPVAAAVATSGIPDFADDLDPSQLPTDTQAAMEYLLSQLDPRRVKDHKVFPRVCMIHQIYGIVKDHTTVDRTLDQLIKNGTIRKFFLGGTGSDEFAVMFTADYVQQIEDAKAQFRELVTGGNHLEVMIQHLTLQNAIEAQQEEAVVLQPVKQKLPVYERLVKLLPRFAHKVDHHPPPPPMFRKQGCL
ncbi:Serine/threonine-protein kinase 19 [Actinomortierella ambigua]|nr:Serine/threonine-protein kinase 19 [Actinomortierella ambigua]